MVHTYDSVHAVKGGPNTLRTALGTVPSAEENVTASSANTMTAESDTSLLGTLDTLPPELRERIYEEIFAINYTQIPTGVGSIWWPEMTVSAPIMQLSSSFNNEFGSLIERQDARPTLLIEHISDRSGGPTDRDLGPTESARNLLEMTTMAMMMDTSWRQKNHIDNNSSETYPKGIAVAAKRYCRREHEYTVKMSQTRHAVAHMLEDAAHMLEEISEKIVRKFISQALVRLRRHSALQIRILLLPRGPSEGWHPDKQVPVDWEKEVVDTSDDCPVSRLWTAMSPKELEHIKYPRLAAEHACGSNFAVDLLVVTGQNYPEGRLKWLKEGLRRLGLTSEEATDEEMELASEEVSDEEMELTSEGSDEDMELTSEEGSNEEFELTSDTSEEVSDEEIEFLNQGTQV